MVWQLAHRVGVDKVTVVILASITVVIIELVHQFVFEKYARLAGQLWVHP